MKRRKKERSKYSISFIDGFYIHNWGEDLKKAFDEICKSFAGKKVIDEVDIEGFNVFFTIPFLSTRKMLKKNVEKILDNYGRLIDVFSVYKNNSKKPILTEEDF